MTKNTPSRSSGHNSQNATQENLGFFGKYSKSISRAMKTAGHTVNQILASVGLASALAVTDASAAGKPVEASSSSYSPDIPTKDRRDLTKIGPTYLVRPEGRVSDTAPKTTTKDRPKTGTTHVIRIEESSTIEDISNPRIENNSLESAIEKAIISSVPKVSAPLKSHIQKTVPVENISHLSAVQITSPIESEKQSTEPEAPSKKATVTELPTKSAEVSEAQTNNKPRWARVKGPTTVQGFMLENFGVKTGWQNLVDMETGARVLNPNRDLRVGHNYFFTNSEEEAVQISESIKNRKLVAIEKKTEKPVVEKVVTAPAKVYIKPNEKNSFTVTRPNLSAEANDFLVDLAQKPRTIDQGKMYSLRIPDDELKSIAYKMKIGEEEIPVVITLMSHIAKKESQWNYGAFGALITHKSAHQGHRAIGITQIMPINWINWSQKFYGKILDITDTNQERVGFAQIAEYYRQSRERGHKLPQILNNLAIAWYGSVKVKGLQTPTDYAQGFINSVYSDKTRVRQAEEILAKFGASLATGKKMAPVASVVQKNPDIQLASYEPKPTSVTSQVTKMTESVLNMPAVNDPSYFKSSPVVSQGMSKVIELKSYLMKKKVKTVAEETHASNLTEL